MSSVSAVVSAHPKGPAGSGINSGMSVQCPIASASLISGRIRIPYALTAKYMDKYNCLIELDMYRNNTIYSFGPPVEFDHGANRSGKYGT
jgi:hypothetical protein